MKIFLLLLLTIPLFSYNQEIEYSKQFKQLQDEKQELIDRYEIRVEVARLDRMYKRVRVLALTLECLKESRSKHEIRACKVDERRRIMNMIRNKDK